MDDFASHRDQSSSRNKHQNIMPSLNYNKRAKKGGTLSAPSRNDSITSCSKVMYRHIMRLDVDHPDPMIQKKYDVDNFITKQYSVCMPAGRGYAMTVFQQTEKEATLPAPDEQMIHRFVKRIVERVHLNAECVIIALIYIERLMELRSININSRNWIPIVVAALLTASKVWDDHSTFNGDLPAVIPIFSLQAINDLERRFLGDLNYELHISSSDYARYYFGLRALRKKEVRQIPKYYLSIGLGGNREVTKKSLAQEAELRGIPMSL